MLTEGVSQESPQKINTPGRRPRTDAQTLSKISADIKRKLRALPPKPKRPAEGTLKAVIEDLRSDINRAMRDGWNLKDVCELAQESGLAIGRNTFTTYLYKGASRVSRDKNVD